MASITAYQTYQQQMEDELAARVTAHKAKVARLSEIMPSVLKPLNLLADGDSWFDYPLGDALPGVNTDVIAQLPAIISPQPLILSLAHFGDATTTILGTAKAIRLQQQLSDPANGVFDAILFSGGGDDMVGDQFRLWLHQAALAGCDPVNALNQQAFADIMGVVQTAYLDLAAIRDSYAPGIPIFVHAYDYAQPTNIGVCTLGPWLYPSLHMRGWMSDLTPPQITRGADIVAAALNQFDLMLRKLAQDPQLNFIRVPTLGTLLPATDWANELHPKPSGFKKIAQCFAAALRLRFGSRAFVAPALTPPPTPADVAALVIDNS